MSPIIRKLELLFVKNAIGFARWKSNKSKLAEGTHTLGGTLGFPLGFPFGFNRKFRLRCGTRPLASNSRIYPALPVA
jgi:hypothetical protein